MKKAYVKDSGVPIVGIRESVPCVSYIDGFDNDGEPVYSGAGSDMHWDNQYTDGESLDEFTFVDENGASHGYDEIEFREVDDA